MKRKKDHIDTEEFKNNSLFSSSLRKLLKIIIIPLSAPADRYSYRLQFDQASRNIEITLERLGKLLAFHPRKATAILQAIHSWQQDYFSAQSATKDLELYDVYTEQDRSIPFLPEEDIMYTYINTQIAIIAEELAKRISHKEIKQIAQGFLALNRLATQAFRNHPTVMPRYTDHNRISLRTIQRIDAPLNCCPSLHIAYSLFLDNIAEDVLLKRFSENHIFADLRYSTLRMFNSVLYTKQHSLIDVAFGMLAAKTIYEQRYQRPFNDLSGEFSSLQAAHPAINYDTIERIYREACALHEKKMDYVDILGRCLKTQGLTKTFYPH